MFLSSKFYNYLSSSVVVLGLLCASNAQAMNTDAEEGAAPRTAPAKKSSAEGQEMVKFLTPHRPKKATDEYFKRTVTLYLRMASLAGGKKDILHDERDYDNNIMPGTACKDYGYNNPLVLGIHGKLLQFCTQSKARLNIIDVGPGVGFDTVGMLLTQKANVQAMEKQKRQTTVLTRTVESSIKEIDATLLKRFRPVTADFLTFKITEGAVGAYDAINASQVIHFFDPSESSAFVERAHTLLKPGGRVFITCLTPTSGSEIEKFMASQKDEEEFPGYLFYKQRHQLLEGASGEPYLGNEKTLEVRKPKKGEDSAYFKQEAEETGEKILTFTGRVMHYHTLKTLTRLLGDRFSIIDSTITLPDGKMGTDTKISIVAQKKSSSEKTSSGEGKESSGEKKKVSGEEKKEKADEEGTETEGS